MWCVYECGPEMTDLEEVQLLQCGRSVTVHFPQILQGSLENHSEDSLRKQPQEVWGMARAIASAGNEVRQKYTKMKSER